MDAADHWLSKGVRMSMDRDLIIWLIKALVS
jgi:hypothetical protein